MNQKFAYLKARHENEEMKVERLRQKVEEDVAKRAWYQRVDNSDGSQARHPTKAQWEDFLVRSNEQLSSLMAKVQVAQDTIEMHGRQLNATAIAVGIDLCNITEDGTPVRLYAPDREMLGGAFHQVESFSLPSSPHSSLVPPALKCNALFGSGPKVLDDAMECENCAAMISSAPEPLRLPLAHFKDGKAQPAAVASNVLLPQSLEVDILGHVIREELEPVQELVQDWAARQKTSENRIAVLEQRFNHLSTADPLSSLSSLWRPKLCC